MKKIRSLAVASLFVLSVTPAFAMTFTENFANDPSLDGWQVFGNPDLFHWESANQNVAVTWNSTNANSYFYRPLGVTLNSRSEEHTSELQSLRHLVCRLLLEKK